jgi:hypothetical protein
MTKKHGSAEKPGGLRLPLALVLVAVLLCGASSALGADWTFDQSLYTNSPTTGKRVDQYKKIKPVDRIPFQKFFSEDGPHPFEEYSSGYGSGFGDGWGYGYGGYGGYGAAYPFVGPYPMGSPALMYGPAPFIAP